MMDFALKVMEFVLKMMRFDHPLIDLTGAQAQSEVSTTEHPFIQIHQF